MRASENFYYLLKSKALNKKISRFQICKIWDIDVDKTTSSSWFYKEQFKQDLNLKNDF